VHPLVRSFRDYFGREWEASVVRITREDGRPLALANPALVDGDSLLFTSSTQRRALSPLPPGWYIASDELLSRWCDNATPVADIPS
jgi:hypothetical protein